MNSTRAFAIIAFAAWNGTAVLVFVGFFALFFVLTNNFGDLFSTQLNRTRFTVEDLSCVETDDGETVITWTVTNAGAYRSSRVSAIARANKIGGATIGTYGTESIPSLSLDQSADFELRGPVIEDVDNCEIELWAFGSQVNAYGQPFAVVRDQPS